MEIDEKTLNTGAIAAGVVLFAYILFGGKKSKAVATPVENVPRDTYFPSHIRGTGKGRRMNSNPNAFGVQGSSMVPVASAIHWYAIENQANDAYWQNADVNKIVVQLKPGSSQYLLQALMDKYGLMLSSPVGIAPSSVNVYTFTIPTGTKEKMLQIVRDAQLNPNIVVAEPAPLIVTAQPVTATP